MFFELIQRRITTFSTKLAAKIFSSIIELDHARHFRYNCYNWSKIDWFVCHLNTLYKIVESLSLFFCANFKWDNCVTISIVISNNVSLTCFESVNSLKFDLSIFLIISVCFNGVCLKCNGTSITDTFFQFQTNCIVSPSKQYPSRLMYCSILLFHSSMHTWKDSSWMTLSSLTTAFKKFPLDDHLYLSHGTIWSELCSTTARLFSARNCQMVRSMWAYAMSW